MVVAINEYPPWRVYTIDDSSGATIECPAKILPVNPGRGASTNATTTEDGTNKQRVALGGAAAASHSSKSSAAPAPDQAAGPKIDKDVDVGHVLDVRGGIRLFRQFKQIRVEKIIHLESTDHEVRFWDKLVQFRKDILDHPWVLDRRVVRRCRKEAEGLHEASERRKKRTQKAAKATGRAEVADSKDPGDPPRRPPATGLEKKAKRPRPAVPVEGKYSALGM